MKLYSRNLFKWSVPLIILTIIVAVVYQDYVKSGLPYTHDSQNHVARMAQFYLALKEGQLPPRFAPQLNNGFGYPVFNFNYPLANIAALPLVGLNISFEDSFKLISLGGLMAGVWGMYIWLRRRYGVVPSLLGSLLYGVNPYQASLLFVRGSIGETLALALLPWVLLAFDFQLSRCLFRRVGLVVVLSLFWLSHNILVFFSLPLIAGYLFWLSWRDRFNYKRIMWPVGMSLLLVAWFWLPALAEKGHTNLDSVSLSTQYLEHFPSFSQLLAPLFSWGFSYPGPVDSMSFAIGWVGLVVLFIFIFTGVWRYINLLERVLVFFLAGYLFMILPISKPLWQILPLVHFVQFPWRLLAFVVLLLAFLATVVMSQVGKMRWWIVFVAVYVTGLIGVYRAIDRFSFSDEYWLTYSQSTSILDENMPQGFDKFKAYELVDSWFINGPLYIEGEGDYAIERWTGSGRTYQINTDSRMRVFERGAWFLGWEVYANGTKMALAKSHDNPGLIEFELEPGSYTVESRLTQRTPARLIGNTLSLLGIMSVGYMGFYDYSNRKK